MGFLLSGTQIGPAFGPFVGGVIVTFTTWRVIFWVQSGLAVIALLLVIFVLPETMLRPRIKEIRETCGQHVRFVPINPLRPILLFKYPNLLLTGIACGTLTFSMYSMITPIRYVIDPRFHLTSPLQAAFFYLAPGMGYLAGTQIGGRYADRVVRRWIRRRNGLRVPEDRHRTGLWALGITMPGSILIYGWCVDKAVGGIPVPVIALFVNAFSQLMVFPSLNAYSTEVMSSRSTEVVGSKYLVQYVFAAAASASCLPTIKAIGVGWTSTICKYWSFHTDISCICVMGRLHYGLGN